MLFLFDRDIYIRKIIILFNVKTFTEHALLEIVEEQSMIGVAKVEQRFEVLVHQMRFVQRQNVPGRTDERCDF